MADENQAADAVNKVKEFFEQNADKLGGAADDALAKAKTFYEENKDKVDEALKSEQAEGISDNVLDTLAGLAKKILPEDQAGKIDEVRGNLDKAVGHE
ncbi:MULTISPECIES: antitoxin [unclassified Microbacterium]|uniref:antitoxin n=1 Tax=unclassified Microbacterium TaxID=2609290 RepID=UPI001E63EC04|nr:antitoxin [Microbacterium sp. MAH-37]